MFVNPVLYEVFVATDVFVEAVYDVLVLFVCGFVLLVNEVLYEVLVSLAVLAVSYTHLRAHET